MIASIRCVARSSCVALLLLVPGRAALAQTSDEARLTLGISAGFIGGASELWGVASQRIASTFENEPDYWRVGRSMPSGLTVNAHVTMFPTPHVGFTGEFTYLGLGTLDACTVLVDDGDPTLVTACNALDGNKGAASVATVQSGVVYRPLDRTTLQPYVTGMVGVAFTPTSTIAMSSPVVVDVYTDDAWKSIRISWTAVAGIATAPGRGSQLRLEVRDTWLPLGVVTGGNAIGPGFVPPAKSVMKSFPSVLVGFDVVLQKQRGKRY